MRIFRLVLGILLFCGVCCSLLVPTEVRASKQRGEEETPLATTADTQGSIDLKMQSYAAEQFYNKGQYGEARMLYEEVLATQEKHLGADHPSTLITRGNLAIVLQKLGEYGKAKELFEQVNAAQEKALGTDLGSAPGRQRK